MINFKTSLPQNIRVLLTPVLTFLVLLILLYICLSQGLAKVSTINKKINEARKKENLLVDKESLLYQFADTVSGQTNLVSVVLPAANPALLMLSQIKSQALANGLVIANVKVGGTAKEKADIAKVELTFEIEGPISNLVSLVASVKNLAPLSLVDKIDLKLAGGSASAEVGISSFWSPYPEKMASITDQAKDLTEAENELLGNLVKLSLPFFSNLVPAAPAERESPF
jgi:hypothetical protein